LKIKVLESLLEMIGSIDKNTMQDQLLKSFEKLRQQENEPQVCMHLLKLYEKMGTVLGPDEIGLRILPGMIPMLISGSLSKPQFKELVGSIRKLIDQIEQHREKDLTDFDPSMNT